MAIWRVYPHPHHPLSVVAVFHIPRSNPDVSYPRTPLKVLDLHTVLRDEDLAVCSRSGSVAATVD